MKKKLKQAAAAAEQTEEQRGKFKSEKSKFFRLSARDKQSGTVLLDLYQLRPSGQPFKIDKLSPPLENFSDSFLTDLIAKKHGAGLFRVKHYNLEGGKYSSWDCTIRNNNQENFSLAADNMTAEAEKKIKELENENLKIRQALIQQQQQSALIQMQILETKSRIDLNERRENLEIKRLEMEINEENGGGIIDKLLAIVQDTSNPIGQLAQSFIINAAGKLDPKGKEKK
jgi:hypothetical protein